VDGKRLIVLLNQNGSLMIDVLSRVQQVIADALDVPIELVTPDTTADKLGKWDSHRLLFTILALEEEFDIEFDFDVELNQAIGDEMPTVRDVAELIGSKIS
jgi:acyl carrier protein